MTDIFEIPKENITYDVLYNELFNKYNYVLTYDEYNQRIKYGCDEYLNINCIRCYDCLLCTNCVGCSKSFNSVNCDNCLLLTFCASSVSIIDSKFLTDCYDCSLCNNCNNCKSCKSCNNCNNCFQCERCNNCLNCLHSKKCIDCINTLFVYKSNLIIDKSFLMNNIEVYNKLTKREDFNITEIISKININPNNLFRLIYMTEYFKYFKFDEKLLDGNFNYDCKNCERCSFCIRCIGCYECVSCIGCIDLIAKKFKYFKFYKMYDFSKPKMKSYKTIIRKNYIKN